MALDSNRVHEIAREVTAPDRWKAALQALAEALGITDIAALEAALREHLGDEFLSGAPGGFDAAAVAQQARQNANPFAQ